MINDFQQNARSRARVSQDHKRLQPVSLPAAILPEIQRSRAAGAKYSLRDVGNTEQAEGQRRTHPGGTVC